MNITKTDIKRLQYSFDKRIYELGKIAYDSLDIREAVNLEIQEYQRTLDKIIQLIENNN